MAAVTPKQAGGSGFAQLRADSLSRHAIYAVSALANGETLATSPYGAGSPAGTVGAAWKLSAGDLLVTNVSGTLTANCGSAATGDLHLFGRRLSAATGTGAARISLWNDERSLRYAGKRHLIFDFASMSGGDTWSSNMRAEVFDYAWQDYGSGAALSNVSYVPATGVFTFAASFGSPVGLLHVWTHG